MRLKKRFEELIIFIDQRFAEVNGKIDSLKERQYLVELQQDRIDDLKKLNKEFLDRLMARDFQEFQTFTVPSGEETETRDVRLEEDPDMAGEEFEVT